MSNFNHTGYAVSTGPARDLILGLLLLGLRGSVLYPCSVIGGAGFCFMPVFFYSGNWSFCKCIIFIKLESRAAPAFARTRLAAEESFSWHHHFGPSPAFFDLRPPMDDPIFFNPFSLSTMANLISAADIWSAPFPLIARGRGLLFLAQRGEGRFDSCRRLRGAAAFSSRSLLEENGHC